MYVRVELEIASPRMQHSREAKLGGSAEPFRIAPELEERVGGGFHEQLEDEAPVAQRQ